MPFRAKRTGAVTDRTALTNRIHNLKDRHFLENLHAENPHLKKIAKQCGIQHNLTFHLARHSFATLALTKGMPIESVSKILGHTQISTTQIYLDSFDKEERARNAALL